MREFAENGVARGVPRRVARAAACVAALLAPALFRRGQRMMAGETLQFGILRPILALGAPGDSLHRRAKLHGLPGAPIAHAGPGVIFRRHARSAFARRLPVARHHRGKGIELKIQIGMARRRSFRDRRIFPACPDGRTGTFPCAAPGCACRTFPRRSIARASSCAWCAGRATRMRGRGSFRSSRLRSAQMFSRAHRREHRARGRRGISAAGSDLPSPRMRPMRSPIGPVSAS